MIDQTTSSMSWMRKTLASWYQPIMVLIILGGAIGGAIIKWNDVNEEITDLTRRVSSLEEKRNGGTLSKLQERVKILGDKQLALGNAIESRYFSFDISKMHKGKFKSGHNKESYPIASVIGWHMKCPGSKNRDIESLFVEPDSEGYWWIYMENQRGCEVLDVYVAFVKNNLAEIGDYPHRDDPLGEWKVMKRIGG